jgi:peptidoglycan/LPS O-acetylase OafA/YrhL
MEDRKYPEFDGLRAFAVFLTAYQHWIYEVLKSSTYDRWYHYPFKIQVGGFGVTVFFVISGFLITQILTNGLSRYSDGKEFSVRNFYVRRTLRIFPLYFATIVCVTLIRNYVPSEGITWHIFYLSNIHIFLQQTWVGSASHFWTLSVEEQFYLVWPLALILMGKSSVSKCAIVLIVLSVAGRILLPILFPEKRLFDVLPIIAMDAIALGAILSTQSEIKRLMLKVLPPMSVLYFGLLLISPFHETQPALEMIRYFCSVAAAVYIVHQASIRRTWIFGRVLNFTPVRSVGVMSYGVYLFHNFAGAIMNDMFRLASIEWSPSFWIRITIMTAITLLAALVSWTLFERPINNLKRFFPYRITPSANLPPQPSSRP